MNLTFIYLATFERSAAGLLTDTEMLEVERQLLANPQAGAVIARTGGARKLRVALPGQGKRGSARVIYAYVVVASRVYFILAYAKNRQADLSAAQKAAIAAIVRQLQAES